MLIFLATLLATASSIVRSRAALELENLALRHQIGVLQRCARKRPKVDSTGPSAVGLALPRLERLALGAGHRSTRNGACLASRCPNSAGCITVTNDGLPEKPDHLLPPSQQSNLIPRYAHVRSRQSARARTATNGEVFAERINRCGQDGI